MGAMWFRHPREINGGIVTAKSIDPYAFFLNSFHEIANDGMQTECSDAALPSMTITSNAAASPSSSIPPSSTQPVATQPTTPSVTPAPTMLPREALEARAKHALAKRESSVPSWLAANWYDEMFVLPACSCIITSALPVTQATQTSTITQYTSTVVSFVMPLRHSY
jgi:hypothetical protein